MFISESIGIPNIISEIIDENKLIYFRNLFYTSLPHEIRSKVASLGFFLKSLSTNDKEEILNKLKETTEWKHYQSLYNFNPKKYLHDLLLDFNIDILIISFNYFNKLMSIETEIKNETDLLNYFKNTKRYFRTVCKSYNKKISKIINHVVNAETIKDDGTIHETFDLIIKYDDYCKKRNDRLDDLLSIHYEKFYDK